MNLSFSRVAIDTEKIPSAIAHGKSIFFFYHSADKPLINQKNHQIWHLERSYVRCLEGSTDLIRKEGLPRVTAGNFPTRELGLPTRELRQNQKYPGN